MCDYSLHSVRSRPAKIGDKLVTKDFGTGTRGFASVTDASTAVCVLPGTELAFASEVRHADWTFRSLIRGNPGRNTSQDRDRPADQQRTGGNPPRCAGVPRWKGCAPHTPI
jgi:hypothetical protein